MEESEDGEREVGDGVWEFRGAEGERNGKALDWRLAVVFQWLPRGLLLLTTFTGTSTVRRFWASVQG